MWCGKPRPKAHTSLRPGGLRGLLRKDCLKLEQGLTEWKMVKRLMKEPPKPREKKWLNYDNNLAAIIESYEDNDDRLDFHKIVGSMMSV